MREKDKKSSVSLDTELFWWRRQRESHSLTVPWEGFTFLVMHLGFADKVASALDQDIQQQICGMIALVRRMVEVGIYLTIFKDGADIVLLE